MRLFFLFVFIASVLAAATPPQDKPRKLALIIAIGEYGPATGWKKISSINDIRYIRTALLQQGFNEADIDTLKNEQATYSGIRAALQKLIDKARPGDIVVFHYSGHGQQIYDDGNKDEMDGYDEALVAYDANAKYSAEYKGQAHLRDDELGALLKLLRKKISGPDKSRNGSLLVMLDACHSGTGTRGQDMAITRGTAEKCEPEGYEKTITQSRGSGAEGVFDDKELLSNMVVISAASADQLNYETKDAEKSGVGALSYAFSRALSQTSGVINYKILFEKIKTDIQSWTPSQNPQIEGNTDQQVLGGTFITTPDIIRISRWNSDNTLEIPRGSIHAVLKGARFSLYEVEVTDFKKAKPIASGTITESGMVKATGKIDGTLPPKGKAYNVVFEAKSYGELGVAVKIALGDEAMASAIRSSLSTYSFVSFDAVSADLSVLSYKQAGAAGEKLQLVARNDSVLWEKDWAAPEARSLTDDELEKIRESVKLYSRAQYLRSVQTPADAKVFEYVQVDIIPGTVRKVNGEDSLVVRKSIKDITDAKGNIVFLEADPQASENEGFVISVRNMHDYPVYISVLDIMPNNDIGVVIPDPNDVNSTAAEYMIPPRSTKPFITRPITLYPPYGRDFMKIIITRTPMDLKGIQQRTGSRGAGTSFEQFFDESFKDGNDKNSRGPQVAPVKVDEVKIVPFTYLIVKRG